MPGRIGPKGLNKRRFGKGAFLPLESNRKPGGKGRFVLRGKLYGDFPRVVQPSVLQRPTDFHQGLKHPAHPRSIGRLGYSVLHPLQHCILPFGLQHRQTVLFFILYHTLHDAHTPLVQGADFLVHAVDFGAAFLQMCHGKFCPFALDCPLCGQSVGVK